RLAGEVHARLVVRVVHQPRAVEAARGRGAAPLVADTQLRARRVDGGLPVEVAAGAGGAGPAAATTGDAHAAVQRVPRLRADHGVHADAGRGLQGTHRRAGGGAEDPVDRQRGAGAVELLLQGGHGGAAIALAQLRLRPGGGGRGGGTGQRVPGLRAHHAVHADAGAGLTVLHGPQGRGAEDAVDLQRGAVGIQALLEVGHGRAPRPEAQLDGRVLGLGGRGGARSDARDGAGGGARGDAADGSDGRGGRRLGGGRGTSGECGGRGDGAYDGGASDTPTHRGGEPSVIDHGTAGSPVRAS